MANPEEIKPRTSSTWDEAPLILFTLLGQMAVGGFWAMSLMFPPLWAFMAGDTTVLRLIPSLLIGISLGAGMVFSFAHLGTKRNAWRVLAHLRRSWLSREILFAGTNDTSEAIEKLHENVSCRLTVVLRRWD